MRHQRGTTPPRTRLFCRSLQRAAVPPRDGPSFCGLARQYDDMGRMCHAMQEYLRFLCEHRDTACLVCCAAGGKELLVPLRRKGKVADAAVFTFRSPRKDRNHLRELSVYLGIPQEALDAAWRSVRQFSPAAAEHAIVYLNRALAAGEHGFPSSADFDAQGIRMLAAAYDQHLDGKLRFYDLDIRVFGMIGGLRALPGVRAVQLVYHIREGGTSIARFFQRQLGPVLPFDPPIYGLRVPEGVGRKLHRYLCAYEGESWRERPHADDTLAGAVLDLQPRNARRLPFTYTFRLPVGPTERPAARTGQCAAAADVALWNDYPGDASLSRACLAAASDWTDWTALGELLQRLPPADAVAWDDFKTLVAQFAEYLVDSRIRHDRDKWATFMRGLDDTLADQPLGPVDPADAPIVSKARDALEWLSGQPSRNLLNHREGREWLRKVRHVTAATRG